MSEDLKISIITPSLNQDQFLEESIESVLNQAYPNLEYIIIDGGSSDNSVEIIKKHSDRITYWVSEPDNGQAHAVNKGISHAHGDIIGWLNSDDIYLPNCLDTIIEVFQRNPMADVVYGDHIFVDDEGNELLKKKEISVDFNIMFWGRNHIAQPAVFFRKNVLDRAGLLDEKLHYALDWEWWHRMGKAGCRFVKIKKFLAAAHWQFDSKSVTNQNKFKKERKSIQTAYLNGKLNPGKKWLIPFVIFILDKFYRFKWHGKKLFTRGSFDIIQGRMKLRRNGHKTC